MEILKLLKRNNPSQYIISFSGQRAIHELEEFWKISDAQIKKPVPLAECKQKLDDAIRDRANLFRYWDEITRLFHGAGVPESDIRKFEKRIVRQVRKRDVSPTVLDQLVSTLVDDEPNRKRVIAISLALIQAAIHYYVIRPV